MHRNERKHADKSRLHQRRSVVKCRYIMTSVL